MTKPTCGPLFLKSLFKFTDGSREQVMAFSAGHMTGQAEKGLPWRLPCVYGSTVTRLLRSNPS